MKLSMQTRKLKKNMLHLYQLIEQYYRGKETDTAKIFDIKLRLPENLTVDIEYLNKNLSEFCNNHTDNAPNWYDEVMSYDSGNVVYSIDVDNIFAYNEKSYEYHLDIDDTAYRFPMGKNSYTIDLNTLLFNNSTHSMSRLVRDYPQIIDYIFKAYEESKIASIENEKASLIKRLVDLQQDVEDLQYRVWALESKLPIGKRVKNFAKSVFNIKEK